MLVHAHLLDLTLCLSGATGVDKEVRQWPALLELGALLPCTHLQLVLVSPELPQELSGQQFEFASPQQQTCGSLKCSCARSLLPSTTSAHEQLQSERDSSAAPSTEHRGSVRLRTQHGLYHDAWDRLPPDVQHPDMVLGLNAGNSRGNLCLHVQHSMQKCMQLQDGNHQHLSSRHMHARTLPWRQRGRWVIFLEEVTVSRYTQPHLSVHPWHMPKVPKATRVPNTFRCEQQLCFKQIIAGQKKFIQHGCNNALKFNSYDVRMRRPGSICQLGAHNPASQADAKHPLHLH